jgi:hypothetical protein
MQGTRRQNPRRARNTQKQDKIRAASNIKSQVALKVDTKSCEPLLQHREDVITISSISKETIRHKICDDNWCPKIIKHVYRARAYRCSYEAWELAYYSQIKDLRDIFAQVFKHYDMTKMNVNSPEFLRKFGQFLFSVSSGHISKYLPITGDM